MHRILNHVVLASALAICPIVGACTADVHDNTVNVNAKIDMKADVDVSNVQAGQTVPVTVNAEGVFLFPPDQTPPPEHAGDAEHFQFYFDSTDDDPLVITAETNVHVVVPSSAPPGDHKLICRLHKHDGTPTNVETEIKITVKASVTTP